MSKTGASHDPEIHTLIQQRKYDLYGFIHGHMEKIDNHVEVCAACRERMIGWSSHLPKLRARVTVQFPKPTSHGEYMGQLEQLKRGQCLPCGCEVTDVTWSKEDARTKFCKTLAEVLQISEDHAKKIPAGTKLLDLPLTPKSLRRLRDMFWLPDGSSLSEELRDAAEGEKVLQLPETVEDFIAELVQIHSGMAYMECSEHWSP